MELFDIVISIIVFFVVLTFIGFLFVGIPLLWSEQARQQDNAKNNTNKTLGEWMADNKGTTVLNFLTVPILIILFAVLAVPPPKY